MPRRNIERLPKAPKHYRPSKTSHRFESKKTARGEDAVRLRLVRRLLKRSRRSDTEFSVDHLNGLIRSIKSASSPASSVYMRKQRNRIAGNLWAAIASDIDSAHTFTLLPRSWEVCGGNLHEVNPCKLIRQLRSALARVGFSGKDGWILCAIHGEHEPNADIYVLHVHGIAQGTAALAIDKLRKQRDFQSLRSRNDKVYRRVRMSRRRFTELPDTLAYIVQSFWPERVAFENADGYGKRQRGKRRVEEPRHTEILLWLDRWRLRDTCLSVGIQTRHNGLKVSNETCTNGSRL